MRGECGTARPLRPRLLPGGWAGQAVGGAAAGSPARPPRSPAQPQPRLQLQHLQVRGFKGKIHSAQHKFFGAVYLGLFYHKTKQIHHSPVELSEYIWKLEVEVGGETKYFDLQHGSTTQADQWETVFTVPSPLL